MTKDKVVLITGGSDGLGKSIAFQLHKEGYQVVILSPNKEKLEKAAKQVGCNYFVADVTDYHSLEQAVSQTVSTYGQLDCLINCAGVFIEGEIELNTESEIARVVEVNLTGTMLTTKAVIPQMKKQKQGLIINIVSQAGLYGKAERSVYNASKWGVTGLTKSLQMELSKYGIRITGIYPAKVNTQLFVKSGVIKDMKDAMEPEEVAKLVSYILSTNENIVIPEVGIKHILAK